MYKNFKKLKIIKCPKCKGKAIKFLKNFITQPCSKCKGTGSLIKENI